LLDWTEAGAVNELLVDEMQQVRELITAGLSLRAETGIKVRQPLSSATVTHADPLSDEAFFSLILTEELNVKQVIFEQSADVDAMSIDLDMVLTPALRQEGLMREVIRHVQQARKQAELQVDDHIALQLTTHDAELNTLVANTDLTDVIKQETLAESLNAGGQASYETTVKVDGSALTIALAKI
jgi:isoleucyl-tRNA synthetase